MDNFIGRANVRHFGDRLRSESNPDMRARLHKLLIEEENKLGRDLELIAEVERTISSFDALIQTQASVVTSFEHGRSYSLAEARKFLDSLIESRTLYKDYHRRLVNGTRIHQT